MTRKTKKNPKQLRNLRQPFIKNIPIKSGIYPTSGKGKGLCHTQLWLSELLLEMTFPKPCMSAAPWSFLPSVTFERLLPSGEVTVHLYGRKCVGLFHSSHSDRFLWDSTGTLYCKTSIRLRRPEISWKWFLEEQRDMPEHSSWIWFSPDLVKGLGSPLHIAGLLCKSLHR